MRESPATFQFAHSPLSPFPYYSTRWRRAISLVPAGIHCFPLLSGNLVGAGEGEKLDSARRWAVGGGGGGGGAEGAKRGYREARWANGIGDVHKCRGEYIEVLRSLQIDYKVFTNHLSQHHLLPFCQSLDKVFLRLDHFSEVLIY